MRRARPETRAFPGRGLPRRARRAGRSGACDGAVLHGNRRGRGRARGGGQAAARVLRAGRPPRPRGGRARVRGGARTRPARDRRRQARRHRLDRRGLRRGLPRPAGNGASAGRRTDRQPLSGSRFARAVRGSLPGVGRPRVRARTDLESRRRGHPGARARRRLARVGARCAHRRVAGSGGGRRGRRDTAGRGGACSRADAGRDVSAAGRRGSGR